MLRIEPAKPSTQAWGGVEGWGFLGLLRSGWLRILPRGSHCSKESGVSKQVEVVHP